MRLLVNGEEFLRQVEDMVLQIAESFRVKTKEEASREFLSYVEALQQINQLIDVLKKSKSIDILDSDFKGKKGREILSQFIEINKEILTAQENKDFVLIADLLEYELSPSLKEIAEFIKDRREAIEK